MNSKRIHIETWGCQMNVADSERILSLLTKENYVRAKSEKDATLIVLNTCHIREKAKHKVISRLGRLRGLKETSKNLKIAVVGCVAQAEGKRLFSAVPFIDYILAPSKIEQLPHLLRSSERGIAVGFKDDEQPNPNDDTPSPTLSGQVEVSRYLNVMQGCNNYCTFCVVPFTRGREKSQGMPRIIAQAEKLVAGGAKEITLLGQNVNSYGKDIYTSKNPFVELLAGVAKIPALQRLRFTTSNPHDFSQDLIDSFSRLPVLGRYVHLPVQSGSDVILQKMKRKTNVAQILSIVTRLRQNMHDCAISTDIIVGFPDESEEDFQQTLALVRKINFSFIFAFKYSPRRNTPAARFPQQIPEKVKSERLACLLATQKEITLRQNLQEIGQQRQVLVHYQSKKEADTYYGRTDHFRLVKIPSCQKIVGKSLPVLIKDANTTALLGMVTS